MKSRSYRRTIAALVWSEAAAKWLLDSNPAEQELVEAGKAIRVHCDSAYRAIGRDHSVSRGDIKKFMKSARDGGINRHFPDGGFDLQKMVAFCSFLLEEPVTRIKSNRPLQEACQSVADCMSYLAGYIEDDLGFPVFASAVEAEQAYKSWAEVGW
jgi:hypothetical protein